MATLTSTWDLDNAVDEQRYYRSTSPIDIDNPPAPVATLLSGDRSYIDTVPAKTAHHVAVSSVKNGIEKFSDIKYIGDLNWNNVVFYARFDDSAVDLSSKNNYPTIGSGVTYRSTGAKFGKALYANANAAHCVKYPATHMGFAAGEDFTIESWVYCESKPTGLYYSPLGTWTANTGWCFFFTPTGVTFNFRNTGLGGVISYSINTLHSIVVTRKDGLIRLFFNGNVIATLTDNGAIPANQLVIGGNLTTTDWWRGCIDEVRITKGVARYVENFTPQSKQFFDF